MRIIMSKERIPKFKIGDKVKLNVSGPDMAIKKLLGSEKFNGEYRCQWFAGKKLEFGDIPEESLVLIEEEQQEGSTPSSEAELG